MALSDGGIALGDLEINDFTPIWIRDMDLGAETVESEDIDNPVFDDTYAGVDFHRGPTWAFEIVVEGKTPAEVLDRVGRVKRAWRNPAVTKKGGALAELRVHTAGRERAVYGRPRRFACNPMRTALEGYAIIDCDFKLMDPIIYDAAWQSRDLTIVPPLMRGLTEPLTEPLSTGGASLRQGMIDEIGGTAPTPFWVDIQANMEPLSRPYFSIAGNRYEFDFTLARGRRLQVDSRRGVANVNGTSHLSTMTRRTRLKSVRLPASGPTEISFGGVDESGTATARFWWRPAHYSL
ncbi:hypothetical protein [Brevibacterium album]|uniref:hypothetical protein n=1 Tax=Brevibacterium album TaxID=417948 RepID=UPI0004056B8E|nr:hypothetical protein [Brevibacterium album]